MAKKANGATPSRGRRLAVRAFLLCLPSAIGARWGDQLAFCAVSAALWSGIEASLVYQLKLSAACKRVPFALRLLCSVILEVQACWLLAPEGSGPFFFAGAASATASVVVDASSSNGSLVEISGVVEEPKAVRVATLSVVLPCANEGDFVAKTVRSVFAATPKEELREIIVVDDASNPPVARFISDEELFEHRARVIRHETQQGLIRSKKDGGDAALGDAIVFLDCHVKPMEDWTRSIIGNLRANPKRVVVPSITSLDPDTWQEQSPYGGGTKMCLTWDADFFWCNDYPGPYVPIMSGGLLAMTRFWWESIGGYDSEMKAWGGENLDQSLRTWLCGGEIRVAEGSRVAHMWRDPSKPKTMLHYAIPTNDVRRNRLRAAQAWMGGWADKVRSFPEFEDFAEGGPLHIGSLSNIDVYRDRLKCKGFDWYLNRFRDFYQDTGLIPESVFTLRHRASGLCLHHEMNAGKSQGFSLLPCSRGSETQRFHAANGRGSKRGGCCSGLKVWDWDACLYSWGVDKDIGSSPCQHFGQSTSQHLALTQRGLLHWNGGEGCVAALPEPPTPGGGSETRGLQLAPCATSESGAEAKASQAYAKHDVWRDGSFQLQRPSGTDGHEVEVALCLSYFSDDGLQKLYAEPCRESERRQRWTHDDGLLKNVAADRCVDANDMLTPILYPCYPPGSNLKQRLALLDNGWVELPRSWADNGRLRYPAKCLDAEPVAPKRLHVVQCAQAEDEGAHWEKLWEETPLETRLFREAEAKSNFLGRR